MAVSPEYAAISTARKAIIEAGPHVRESHWRALKIAEAKYDLSSAERHHEEGLLIEATVYGEAAA